MFETYKLTGKCGFFNSMISTININDLNNVYYRKRLFKILDKECNYVMIFNIKLNEYYKNPKLLFIPTFVSKRYNTIQDVENEIKCITIHKDFINTAKKLNL